MKRMARLSLVLLLTVIVGFPAKGKQPETAHELPTGNTFFPIGIFGVHPNLLYLSKLKGFDVVHNYHFEESSNKDDELADYLDSAHALGLKVMVGFDRKNYTISRVLQRVHRFRTHPALWAWYLADEPEKAIKDKVQEIASAIQKEDSAHPITIATDSASLAALADIVFAYTYPVVDQPFPLQDLGSYVRRIDQAARDRAPFIALVQTFNWNHYYHFEKRRRSARNPTAKEMRFMAYYGAMKGCRGVFFFSFQTLPIENDNLDYVVAPLVTELKKLRNYLDGKPVDPINYLVHPHAAAWRKYGQTLLIVTNPSSKPIDIPFKSNCRILSDLKNSTTIVINNKMPLDPWGVQAIIVKESIDAK